MECKITPKVGAIIVAGGKGKRMGGSTPKQFKILGQAPILAQSINALAKGISPAEIVVVLPEEHIAFWQNLASRFEVAPHKTVVGGSERFHSVKAGIEALGEGIDIIAVHDAVRPLCSSEMLSRTLECALSQGSAIPVIEVTDSIRELAENESKTLDRSKLRAVQTPQIFEAITLRRAYRMEYNDKLTDDASVVEASGYSVALCQGEKRNIKITTNEDLIYAQALFEQNDESEDL